MLPRLLFATTQMPATAMFQAISFLSLRADAERHISHG